MEPKDNISKQTFLYYNIKKRSIHKRLDLRIVVLLDNKSTMNLFCNLNLVEDIKKVKGALSIHSNGG